ncbi:unnamed protein product [Soboliphyme baturini]|uniref:Uncharacterized protein n=1 Tax=Soboliphyme baturini TaxID=241478 RepID=A0A183J957_9BILA|nr:unnamed protein product [Soboliphyme baturini]
MSPSAWSLQGATKNLPRQLRRPGQRRELRTGLPGERRCIEGVQTGVRIVRKSRLWDHHRQADIRT